MSAGNTTQLTRDVLGGRECYLGTKAQLVAANIVADGYFPGDPGRASTCCSYELDWSPFGKQGPRRAPIKIVRQGQLFDVRRDLAPEERVRQQQSVEWRSEMDRADAEAAVAAAALADSPSTPKQCAKRAADAFWAGFSMHGHYCSVAEQSGFLFKAADRERIRIMASRLYYEIRQAKPRLDVAKRTGKVVEWRSKAARFDEPLQRLLDTVKAGSVPLEPDDIAGCETKTTGGAA